MIKQIKKQNRNEIQINKKNGKAYSTEKGKLVVFLNLLTKGITPYCIFAIIIFGVYFQSLSFGVTGLDDDVILKNANTVKANNNVLVAFKTDALLSYEGSVFYRPMQGLSFIIDSASGKNNIFYFHLTNILIHIFTCCFLYYLLLLFGCNKRIAFFIILIFSVHPLFNQAVIWLPSRGDLLVALFGMVSFIAYIKFIQTKNYLFFFLNIIAFSLAILSKETAVLLPAIYILYNYLHIKNIRKIFNINGIILIILWTGIISGYLVLRGMIIKESMSSGQFGLSSLIYNLPVIPELISKFFLPFNLSVLPQFNLLSILIGLVIITAFLFLIINYKNHFGDYTILFFGWFILFTLTAMFYRHSHLNNAYDYLEHRAYMPLMGIVMLIAKLKINPQKIKIISISALGILLIFTSITLTRASIFKDLESFYSSAINNGSKVALAYYNRGNFYKESGKNELAIQDYSKAVEYKPDYAEAYNNRGLSKNIIGLRNEAIQDYDKVLSLKPHDPGAYNNRGLAKKDLKDYPGAKQDFSRAIELLPSCLEPYMNRAFVNNIIGDIEGAKRDYERAIVLKHDNTDAWFNLGMIKNKRGDKDGAFMDINQAITINPYHAEAYFLRGNIKINSGDNEGAKADFLKAVEINPNFDMAYNGLGFYYFYSKDYKKAIANFEKAAKIQPVNTETWKNLGFARQNIKDKNGACEAWKRGAEYGNKECKELLEEYCK